MKLLVPSDLWTNYVLSFLVPSVVQVRKNRVLVHVEILKFGRPRREILDLFWMTDSRFT